MPTSTWKDLFFKKTGSRLPESMEEVDMIVAKYYGINRLPIVSRGMFPAADMRKIDKEIDEFLKEGGKK